MTNGTLQFWFHTDDDKVTISNINSSTEGQSHNKLYAKIYIFSYKLKFQYFCKLKLHF